jgi:hypothetical protein
MANLREDVPGPCSDPVTHPVKHVGRRADTGPMDGSALRAVAVAAPVGAMALLQVWLRVRRRDRRHELRRLAGRMGFEFSATDVTGCDRLGFAALRRGSLGGIDNVLFGPAGGRAVRVFDVWSQRNSDDRVETRETCALADLGALFPRLRIEPAGPFDRGDVVLEWEEFHRHFVVHTDDERFAYTLLDERMMQFLVRVAKGSTVELGGGYVCFAPGRELPPADWARLVTFLVEFDRHLPRAVWNLYPAPGSPSRGDDGERVVPPPRPPVDLLFPAREYTGDFDWTTGRLDWPELPRLGPSDTADGAPDPDRARGVG